MEITSRDLLLLKKLSSHGILSTDLIRVYCFKSIDSSTVLRKLRKLENKGLVKRILGHESQKVLWSLGIKGSRLARVPMPKSHWNRNLLEHDLNLVSVRLALEGCGISHSWMPEHQIRSTIFKKHGLQGIKDRLVPDGLMGIDIDGRKESVAIEMEMTLKSKKRIQTTLRRYLEKADVHAIWYLSPNYSILNSIFKQWQLIGGKNHGVKFYVSLLPDVLKNPLDTKLMGFSPSPFIKDVWRQKPIAWGAQRVGTVIVENRPSEKLLVNRNHTPIVEVNPG
jgi:DNA-binding HxlR family transcriptional regulator